MFPLCIGYFLWLFSKKIAWFEWAGCSVLGFALAGIMHVVAIHGMTNDTETWSGQITEARQFSAWQEYYEYAVYRTEHYTTTESYTDSKGRSHTRTVQRSRQVFDHWEPTSRWHNENFEWYSNIQTSYSIDKSTFQDICRKFKDVHPVHGRRTTGEHNSRMIAGDPNDYVSDNKTGWIQPVTKSMTFENRIKAAPSVFSFIKVPETIKVFNYPENPNPYVSDRLLGKARKDFDQLKFDQLNARLGPAKRVNLIIVGFDSSDSMLGEYQRAKFVGGKKNDVVICYGNGWAKVFGWTEKELVKSDIQTMFISSPINNDLLPLIEEEVKKNYLIKDWKKFDYISVEPKQSYFVWFIIILVAVQIGLYIFCYKNKLDKDGNYSVNYRNRLFTSNFYRR